MRITENLIRQSNELRREQIRKKEDTQPEFQDDEEGYYMYEERKWNGFLNENKGVFDTTDETSINTAKSIFDKTAIFHTGTE